MKLPQGALPTLTPATMSLRDGAVIPACQFCLDRLGAKDKACHRHYEMMLRLPGIFRMCPYGFTSFLIPDNDGRVIVTGVVAHPRFGDAKESARAKQYPASRTTRTTIMSDVNFYKQVELDLANLEQETRERLPQALHELRKLNAIVKANAEKLGGNDAPNQEVRDIAGSAELMSNIFDVIEALANIDGLRLLKMDEFIAVYDLAFKEKKIFQSRAKIKPIHIHLSGDDSIGISGSRKTFPLVLTVLIENAIKYGKAGSTIDIKVEDDGANCIMQVSNRSDFQINEKTCFDRGVRFVGEALDGDGLGLFLAREIVHAHNGQIECSKNEDLVTMRVSMPAHAQRKGRR